MAGVVVRVASMHPGYLRPARAVGVWWLREPSLRVVKPSVRKDLLIHAFTAEFPHRVLVLSDLSKHPGAHVLPPGPVARRWRGEINEGHWAMCFAAAPRDLTALERAVFPAPEEAEAQARLTRAGVDAIIWSWPDDLEWLVAAAPEHEVLEGSKVRFLDVLPFIPRMALELVLGLGAIFSARYFVGSWIGPGSSMVGAYLFIGLFGAAVGGTTAWIGGRFVQRIDALSVSRARAPQAG